MEKRTPHYKLTLIKTLIEEGRIQSTHSARQGAASLEVDFGGMCEIVKSLSSADFYKSMTTYADHRIWQDVYQPATQVGDVYLKLNIVDDVVIISFKEL